MIENIPSSSIPCQMKDCLSLGFFVLFVLSTANAQEACVGGNDKPGSCTADDASCRGVAISSNTCKMPVRICWPLDLIAQPTDPESRLQNRCVVLQLTASWRRSRSNASSIAPVAACQLQSSACSSSFAAVLGVSCCVRKACSVRLENKFASGTCVPDGLVNCEATLSSVDCPTLSVCCIDENSIVVLAPTTSTRSSTTPPIVAATTSTTSTNVESTGSAAPTAKFPIAIVVGSVVGFIVLVAVVLALVCVMKKRRGQITVAVRWHDVVDQQWR
jgi:hypothetical protein